MIHTFMTEEQRVQFFATAAGKLVKDLHHHHTYRIKLPGIGENGGNHSYITIDKNHVIGCVFSGCTYFDNTLTFWVFLRTSSLVKKKRFLRKDIDEYKEVNKTYIEYRNGKLHLVDTDVFPYLQQLLDNRLADNAERRSYIQEQVDYKAHQLKVSNTKAQELIGLSNQLS